MPEHSSYRVIVIGAGFGGIGMALALDRAGIKDFLVIDAADSIGGTWRDNTYPGAACDVPANLYSYSFSPGRPSRRFPSQPETLAYLRAVAAEHRLDSRIRLGARVTSAEFDERRATWTVTLDGGDTLESTALVCAVGQLNRPALPQIDGRDDFAGPSWHSARWDHEVDLFGKRVAIIGTGASAIQFVPEVAKTAAHVDIYQRTAPYVLPKPDRPYRDVEQTVFDRLPAVRKVDRLRTFLYGELLTSGFVLSRKLLAQPMKMWRRQLDDQITDPKLRDKCVPDYVMGCKRVLFSNDWYPTLARSNVNLVTDPIERITTDGVLAGAGGSGGSSPRASTVGEHRQADVIIYGTGFQTLDFLAPMSITGLDGRELHQAWSEGARAYLGITVSGFPNLFMLYGPNTNLGGNSIIYMLEGQIAYALGGIQALAGQDLDWLDVRPEVQDEFNEWVQSTSQTTVWESGCTSWYTTDSGRNTNNWPDYTFMYRYRIRRFDLSSYRVMPRRIAEVVAQ